MAYFPWHGKQRVNQQNQLPEKLVRCTTLNCFKSQIDNYFNDSKHLFLFEIRLFTVKYQLLFLEHKNSSANSIKINYAIFITLAFFSRFRLDKPKCQTETIEVHWWGFYV